MWPREAAGQGNVVESDALDVPITARTGGKISPTTTKERQISFKGEKGQGAKSEKVSNKAVPVERKGKEHGTRIHALWGGAKHYIKRWDAGSHGTCEK